MNWSRLDYTAAHNAEKRYNQICGCNALDFRWYGSSGMLEPNDILLVDGNGGVEGSGADPKQNDAEWNERDVGRKESDVSRNAGLISDVAQAILQVATLARKRFAQNFQPGRKVHFTPATLVEKLDGDNAADKSNESLIGDDDKIQLPRPS